MYPALDFWFDFSSPYAYLASVQVDDLARRHGREVNWRPFLLGAVMQHTGGQPLVSRPLVADYARRDLPRSARRIGAVFVLPDPFPVATVAAARAFYWLHASEPERAKRLAAALFQAYFAQGRNIGESQVVLAVAGDCGVDVEALAAAMQAPAVKERLREATDTALSAGVCGSPWLVVDGEPFWGNDRLHEVEQWLRTGGW